MGPGGIYEIVNTANGKRYIGSAVDFKKRHREHFNALKRQKHRNSHLQSAWDKHGESVFQFLPMMTVEDPTKLTWWEQRFLEALKPEYNISLSAVAPMMGRKHSSQTKIRMSTAQKGNTNSLGSKRSPEVSAKLSVLRKGKLKGPLSDDHRAAISAGNRGKKLSSETITKISESNKGQKRSPETCANMSLAGLRHASYKRLMQFAWAGA